MWYYGSTSVGKNPSSNPISFVLRNVFLDLRKFTS